MEVQKAKKYFFITLILLPVVIVFFTYDLYNLPLRIQSVKALKTSYEPQPLRRKDEQVAQAMRRNDDQINQSLSVKNDTVAQTLRQKVRVLIWVMTSPKTLNTRAIYVKNSWGKRVDNLLFFSSESDPYIPTIGLNISEGYSHLTAKSMHGFRYVYQHHFQDADWFMKVDDDTYVIMENLRYFLSDKNSSVPVYYGLHFKVLVKQGYHSGGAGYVLSKEALRRLATTGSNSSLCSQDQGYEDVRMGRCLEKLGVKIGSSLDKFGRSRFHCFSPYVHIFGSFLYPRWFNHYQKDNNMGVGNMSDYPITFHYIRGEQMGMLDYLIYHIRLFGLRYGDSSVN